ncbi:maltose alpha-D-glucosyltransferase [Lujinxingia litoralis]|uniref:Maltokinase n=1 Tax=Lujinxingia litoralis TaxID=2211119 RepID=A0A328C2Y4_9DELT|nr:maltose alpha-D-glucosyltransferase [Lujinxingia litoralis]RAL20630.1 maltose alpha-D-glucosyltransferase [Lujinxingia litoralis]
MPETPWYKDAIIYEVHVRSFYDSDGDGIGDLPGLTQRLDYLEELGVTALWLLPFYPSPLKDDGYDIAGYTEVHPDYGTLRDFQTFLREAHRRGLKVITELVLNHTSDQHPWFQRARRAPRGSVERDFYVWSDTPDRYREARIIFSDVKHSNWTYDPVAGQYFWHRFYDHQPDLNFDNPQVRKAVFEIVDFWMKMGIDGLRLDAITYLYEREGTTCEGLPETHAFLRDLRAHVDERYEDRMLLAEANLWPEDAVAFFGQGDECHMAFHFPLMPRLFMAVEMEDRQPIVDILDQTPRLPPGCQWALFLRNHDELTLEMVTDEERDFMYRAFAPELRMRVNLGIRRRLAPLLRGDSRKIRLLYALLLSLPGTPIVYYGDEIGMGDNYHLGDRNGVRTPMQWSADRNGGFSRANPQSLFLPVITDPSYHYLSTNVEVQENQPASLLRWIKRLIALRQRSPALRSGELTIIPCTNHRVLAMRRTTDDDDALIVINLSHAAQHVHLDLSAAGERWPVELWGRTQFPPIQQERIRRYALSLGPYDFYWFRLSERPLDESTLNEPTTDRGPLEVREDWSSVFEGRMRGPFLRRLTTYLQRQPWFNPRARRLESVDIHERIRLRWEEGLTLICLLEANFLDGENELYMLPIAFGTDQRAERIRQQSPHALITQLRLERTRELGELYDATVNTAFVSALLGYVRKNWVINGQEGSFKGHWVERFQDLSPERLSALPVKILEVNHTHTSTVFGEDLVVKLFRRLESGRSVDVEVGQFLLERDFQGVAPFAGHLDYHRGRWEPTTLVTVHRFIPHRADGLTWFLDHACDHLRRQDPAREVEPHAWLDGVQAQTLIELNPDEVELNESDRTFLEQASLLGKRAAELHGVLASGLPETPFEPALFSTSYERTRYHSMRTLALRTMRLLRRHLSEGDPHQAMARLVLDQEPEILARFKTLIGRGLGGLRIRIHGDFHLEEVLRTDDDFIVIDLEGHPWLPIGERRIKRTPLRDVATMLRSFHHTCLLAWQRACRSECEGNDDDESRSLHLFKAAQRWYALCAHAFLAGYLPPANEAGFLPNTPEGVAELLDVMRLQKALRQLEHDLERGEAIELSLIAVTTQLVAP